MDKILFDPNVSGLTRALTNGHYNRFGHPLQGYYPASDTDGILAPLVRTCCN